jgi:hypothetical protein
MRGQADMTYLSHSDLKHFTEIMHKKADHDHTILKPIVVTSLYHKHQHYCLTRILKSTGMDAISPPGP